MNPKEDQTNSEVTNVENESSNEQKDLNYTNEQTRNTKLDEKSIDIEDAYKASAKEKGFL